MNLESKTKCKYCGRSITYSNMRGWVHEVPFDKKHYIRQKVVEDCNNPEPYQ